MGQGGGFEIQTITLLTPLKKSRSQIPLLLPRDMQFSPSFFLISTSTSKVTALQDGHRRIVLQVYLGSDTLEFSAMKSLLVGLGNKLRCYLATRPEVQSSEFCGEYEGTPSPALYLRVTWVIIARCAVARSIHAMNLYVGILNV